MKNNYNLFEPISKNNLIFNVILLLLFFPPLPVAFNSLVFKWQSLIILLFSIETVFLILLKNKAKKISVKYVILFFIPAFWGLVVGLINNNNYFKMFRDFYFFLLPILIYFLLANNKRFFSMFFSKSFEIYIIIVAIIQLLSSFYGFILWGNRSEFRHLHSLISTYLFPFFLILNITKSRKLFTIVNGLVILALILTLGRMDLLFVFALVISVWFIRKISNPVLRTSYIIFLIVSFVSAYFIPLIFSKINFIADASVEWRYIEWLSFVNGAKKGGLFCLFIGKGFGAALKTITSLSLFSGKVLYSIDKFHNVFLFLFYKLGVLGILFLLIFFYSTIKDAFLITKDEIFLIRYAILFFIGVKGLVTGSFTASMSFGIILGLLIYVKEIVEIQKGFPIYFDR